METARLLILLFYAYLVAGVLFACVFLWRGIGNVDDAANGISWKTRALFFPGIVALWPALWRRWKSSKSTWHDTST
ncbi:MAG: hypothetical protein H6574_10530 [Lewinellaceae bacterium]|nr:hypothetical protein [Saprospiraceae bacterium]MCB9317577.1 hypothetical protein [Lewinellaceae bacterium]MCB9331510.1 hypothetical protein [Lewinellaceae bacterium]